MDRKGESYLMFTYNTSVATQETPTRKQKVSHSISHSVPYSGNVAHSPLINEMDTQ